MCLDTVEKILKGRSKTVKVGYKVFSGRPSRPRFKFKSLHGVECVPMGRWIEAVSVQMDEYTTGFHIFTCKKDAEQYTSGLVLKVRYTGVLAIGTQSDMLCVVAKHMYVPRNRKKR